MCEKINCVRKAKYTNRIKKEKTKVTGMIKLVYTNLLMNKVY